MQIRTREAGAAAVLELDGRLDSQTSPVLERAFQEAWERGSTRIVLDCARLRYVSSAGLQVFLVAGQLAQKRGGRIVFCKLQRNLGELFEITRFDTVFPVFASEEAAVASS
jgi:anti-anti-sigma factor